MKLLRLFASTLLACIVLCVPAFAGGYVEELKYDQNSCTWCAREPYSEGWFYGCSASSGLNLEPWIHISADGHIDTGWFTDTDGNIYYLHPEDDSCYGYMSVGWTLIDGNHYYFSEAPDEVLGAMYRDCTTPDGFYVNTDGVAEGF